MHKKDCFEVILITDSKFPFLMIKKTNIFFLYFLMFKWFRRLATIKNFFPSPLMYLWHFFQLTSMFLSSEPVENSHLSGSLFSSSHPSRWHLGLELWGQGLLLHNVSDVLNLRTSHMSRRTHAHMFTNTHMEGGGHHRAGKCIQGCRSHCQLICRWAP